MQTTQFWLVNVTAMTEDPFDITAVRELLEQSDLGGDIEEFVDAGSSVTLWVLAPAPEPERACVRVLDRVKDSLGRRWTVCAEPDVSAGRADALVG